MPEYILQILLAILGTSMTLKSQTLLGSGIVEAAHQKKVVRDKTDKNLDIAGKLGRFLPRRGG